MAKFKHSAQYARALRGLEPLPNPQTLAKMTTQLPNAENAIIDIDKLREYCLNPLHPEGRHKARVFLSALGIVQADAEWLRSAILANIMESSITNAETTRYGVRHTVDFSRVGWANGSIVCPRGINNKRRNLTKLLGAVNIELHRYSE